MAEKFSLEMSLKDRSRRLTELKTRVDELKAFSKMNDMSNSKVSVIVLDSDEEEEVEAALEEEEEVEEDDDDDDE